MKLYEATCPDCEKLVAVTSTGRYWYHMPKVRSARGKSLMGWCRGSGKFVTEKNSGN